MNARPAPRIKPADNIPKSPLAGKRSGSATTTTPAPQPTKPRDNEQDTPPVKAKTRAPERTHTFEKPASKPTTGTGGTTRQQRTIGIELQVLDRLRGAADSLPNKVKDQGILSMNDLINHFLNEGLDRYEAEHNKGKPYRAPGRGLRRGRPVGS